MKEEDVIVKMLAIPRHLAVWSLHFAFYARLLMGWEGCCQGVHIIACILGAGSAAVAQLSGGLE